MTVSPGQGNPPPGADDERGPLTILLDQCERIVQTHEQLRMDTAGDEALRMDVVATTRAALDQCRKIARELVPLSRYSAALDEIYALRARMAYEARVHEAHLDLKTLPATVRSRTVDSVARLRQCARGGWREGYVMSRRTETLKHALELAGASQCLTRSQWEQEQDRHAEEPRDA